MNYGVVFSPKSDRSVHKFGSLTGKRQILLAHFLLATLLQTINLVWAMFVL